MKNITDFINEALMNEAEETIKSEKDFRDYAKNKFEYDEIKEKNYSLSAGQYFDVKIEYVDITQEEYEKMIDEFNEDLAKYVEETNQFQQEISKVLKELKIK